MADLLARYGIYIDDLSKIRVLEPEAANQTNKLKEECQSFVSKITEFEKNSDEFIRILDNLAKEVEKEKMKTIGARNLLRSVAKQREAQKQQMEYIVPFLLNQCGSVLYFLTLQNSDLSLAVPVSNSLTFVFTAITGWFLGEEKVHRNTYLGMILVLCGTMLCCWDKLNKTVEL
ncbi:Intraflagellar transport protein 20 like protein [Atta colombica]|uniref:Intraflagellar transport protein 20 like protein n=1 Tax=Atta colombica TaxID=520822 RepID=A0A195BV63_9HYME|nr:Intraflagellar transport protein 20 like protein [Atta colombica]